MISALNHLETQKINKSSSTSIFIDLTKAFDTVDIDHGFTLLVGIDFDFKLKALGFG